MLAVMTTKNSSQNSNMISSKVKNSLVKRLFFARGKFHFNLSIILWKLIQKCANIPIKKAHTPFSTRRNECVLCGFKEEEKKLGAFVHFCQAPFTKIWTFYWIFNCRQSSAERKKNGWKDEQKNAKNLYNSFISLPRRKKKVIVVWWDFFSSIQST